MNLRSTADQEARNRAIYERERSGPVTFGQLSVLRSLELYVRLSDQSVANLYYAWEVPDGVTIAQLTQAWNSLLRTHESLRTTYILKPERPIQCVHPWRLVAPLLIEVDDSKPSTVRMACADLIDAPIDITTELPTRAAIIHRAGEPSHLCIVVHHVAADEGAARLLESQFRQELDGGPVAEPTSPIDVASEQLERPSPALDFWEAKWEHFVDEDRDSSDLSRRRRASIYSARALEATRAIEAQTNASVQSIVLAIGALLLSRFLGRESVTFGLMSANRFDGSSAANLISSQNQCAPIRVSVGLDSTAREFIRSIHLEALVAFAHGSFDVDELSRRLANRGVVDPDPTFFSKHVNYLGELPGEPFSSVGDEVRWTESNQHSGPNFHLVSAVGRRLLVGVGASERLLPDERPAELAEAIVQTLVAVAQDPDCPIGDFGDPW